MSKNPFILSAFLITVFTFTTGFGLKDIKKEIKPDTEKCEDKKNKSKCKNKEYLKTGAKVVAVGVAAKLIYDLVVEYTSLNVSSDYEVGKTYLLTNKELPESPIVYAYKAELAPQNIVKVGNKMTVNTKVDVVPSKKKKKVVLEEEIKIYDNEDTSKVLKTMKKRVNDENGLAGSYENSFSFTLPTGLPQGVYPIETVAYLNGKAHKPESNAMQVVLNVLENREYQIEFIALK
ncbi:hypothetical protein TDB9533_02300 [Thalassocella blandensis]|nr:hypothetical protein TDB9533_02300 [Thalassocella blandensis]